MNHTDLLTWLSSSVIAAPACGFLWLALAMLLRYPLRERSIATVCAIALIVSLVATGGTALVMALTHTTAQLIDLGTWYEALEYHFEVTLYLDPLSLTMMFLSTMICGLIGRFSFTYMHREPGFTRFFMLLLLFCSGMLLLVMAGSLDLLFIGWELVGLCSTFLIAFFDERRDPGRNALRTFITYRVCDLGLLFAAVLLHHYANTTSFTDALRFTPWPHGVPQASFVQATILSLLVIGAAIGKSAQFPTLLWLPRAMEGPTPSSALFYGGLSVHGGAYLLLRVAPLLTAAPLASMLLVIVGILSAFVATVIGRTQNDAKNALAYATITQVGVIFIEIGLGFYWLALVHLVGHASLRTFQFLRAPSALQDAQQLHSASGGQLAKTGQHFEQWFARSTQMRLYRLAIERFFLDLFITQYFVRPIVWLADVCAAFEHRLYQGLNPTAPEDAESEQPSPSKKTIPPSKPVSLPR